MTEIFMELGEALEIVHEMARCYADDGNTPIPERKLALDTVEDFIVNNFDELQFCFPVRKERS